MPASENFSKAPRRATARWHNATTVRNAGVVLGVIGMIAGAVLLAAGSALAGVGAEPGDLVLSASTGALSSTPTWSTTDGCPTGYQGSGEIEEFTLTGTPVSRISPAVSVGLTAAFSGTLDGNVGALLNVAGVNATNPGTVEWAIGCWNGPGGTGTGCAPVEYEQSIFVSVADDATTYTTSASAPAGSPTPGASSPNCTPSQSASPTSSPTPTPTTTATPTPTSSTSPATTAALSAPPASSSPPSGAPQTGAGGASRSGPSTLLISLGATALLGSAAATCLAIRRRRWLPGDDPRAPADPGGSW
jgi:hypothetical protein